PPYPIQPFIREGLPILEITLKDEAEVEPPL
ncbi:unnamed protein product, partial [marine sediment metagenome]